TAISGAVLVTALERLVGVTEQERPGRQQLAAMVSAADERTGADEGDAVTRVPLLERSVARTVRAEHVLDEPAVTCREHPRTQARLAEPIALETGFVQRVSNFSQDSLRPLRHAVLSDRWSRPSQRET